MNNSIEKSGVQKWLAAERWFAAAFVAFFLAVFFGNKLIAAGHGLAGIGVIAAFVQKDFRWKWDQFSPSTWCLLTFGVFALLSIVANLDAVESFGAHARKLRYELLVFVLLAIPAATRLLSQSIRLRDTCSAVWLGGLFLTTLFGLASFFFGDRLSFLTEIGYQGRVSGIYGQVMTFAHALLFSSVALAALVMKPILLRQLTRIPHWVFVAATILAGISLYFTYTRGAVLAAAVALFVLAFQHSRRVVIGLVVVAVCFVAYAYNDYYGGGKTPRYFNVQDPVRINQWTTSALALAENPVFGVGFVNFEPQSVKLKERYGLKPVKKVGKRKDRKWVYFKGHSHNNYLEAFAATGVFGGLAFLGFCGFWLFEVSRSKYALLLLPPLVAVLVSGCFENTFFDSEVLNGIILLYVVSQVVLARERSNSLEAGTTPPLSPSP
jgi:O-antigen ligase